MPTMGESGNKKMKRKGSKLFSKLKYENKFPNVYNYYILYILGSLINSLMLIDHCDTGSLSLAGLVTRELTLPTGRSWMDILMAKIEGEGIQVLH